MSETRTETILLTGYPSFAARVMLKELLQHGHHVFLLIMERSVDQIENDIQRWTQNRLVKGTYEVLVGNVSHLDLGLTGTEVQKLIDEVEVVHHMSVMYFVGVPRAETYRVNVDGTRRVLEIAREMKKLRRFCHYSTAQVAGAREGVILETELEAGQRFHNAYEETRFRAERLVRASMDKIPTTIVRPSIVIGDSETGEMDQNRGPHLLLALFVQLPARFPLPLPGRGHFPLNLVPVDYVVQTSYRLSRDPRAEGKTFHLTDPNPLSVRGVFNLVSDLAQRPRPLDAAANLIPYRVARAALRIPGIERRARGVLHLLDTLHSLAIYNRVNTDELLNKTGPYCPHFESYAGRLIEHIRSASQYDFQINFNEDDV